MKNFILLLLLFLNTACANNVEIRLKKKYDGIHKEFKPYVKEFIQMSNGKIDDRDFDGFTIGFKDYPKNSNAVGTCHYAVNEVDIDKKWWKNNNSSLEKFELVFHEFGHCILKRGHTNKPIHDGFIPWLERLGFDIGLFEEKGYIYDGCPTSIMHPYTLDKKCLNKHFYYYIEELFNQEKNINHVERRLRSPDSKRSCKTPKIINETKTWNDRDKKTLKRAQVTCNVRYKSCLKTFWKKSQYSYAALCR